MTRRASTGPMPSCSRSSRNQARSSAGLATTRAAARKSLTCAASVNLRPPYFTNGMPRADSSISSRSLWWAARTSTAWSRRSTPGLVRRRAPGRRSPGPGWPRRGSAPACGGCARRPGRRSASSSSPSDCGRTDVRQPQHRLLGTVVPDQPHHRPGRGRRPPARAGAPGRRRGSRRWPGRRRRRRSARCRPARSSRTMSAWTALTSWYSSTSTASNRPRSAGPAAGSASAARHSSSRSSKSTRPCARLCAV